MDSQVTKPSTDPSVPNVLIIEDNAACRELLVENFRLAHGFGEVIEASCRDEARELFEKHSPEIVICDCYIPGAKNSPEIQTHGLGVVEFIRKKEGFDPVVIMVSGFSIVNMGIAYNFGVDSAVPKNVLKFGDSVVAAARHHLKVRRELAQPTT